MPRPATLVPLSGNVCVGDTFFDRDAEVAILDRHLRSGQHVLLTGQRRTGKTSLLREYQRRCEEAGDPRAILYGDVQDAEHPSSLVVELAAAARAHRGAWEKLRAGWESVLGRLDELELGALRLRVRDATAAGWRVRGGEIVAALASLEGGAVVLLDELSFLVARLLRDVSGRPRPEGAAAAEELLTWLRRHALGAQGRVAFVVAGSIGIGPLAHHAGLSGTLNHLVPMAVEAWEPGVALAALAALSAHEQVELDGAAAERVVEFLGLCIPFHVQPVHQHLVEDARRRRAARIRAVDVERVYRDRVLAAHTHLDLAHAEERLRRALPSETQPLLFELLTEAAVAAPLTVAAARRLQSGFPDLPVGTLPGLLDLLEHDGYLVRSATGWRFASHLLRDWWARRLGTFHTPAAERGP